MNTQPNTSEALSLSNEELIQEAVNNDEGVIASNGAFSTSTGERTGRSPNDRFIVKEAGTKNLIDWGEINKPFEEEKFDALWNKVETYLAEKNRYISNVHVGSHDEHYLPVKVTTETAWHSLFSRLIFVATDDYNPANKQEWQIISAANFVCDPSEDGTNSDGCVIINFAKRKVILAGMKYAGEMKKSMFSVQNFLLPEKGVLPMHCSANVNSNGNVALFFGLSGTGKTTLSANKERKLIGDDEHGWSKDSIFNFEGGCYAKCIDLSYEKEPDIYSAIKKGALLENICLKDNEIDFKDDSITQNTRVSYPIFHIKNIVQPSIGKIPKNIFFLTADAFGVLPPISKLNSKQVMFHFVSGYTAKVAGTEEGVIEPEATFSACFGAPFMPLHPMKYAKMLVDKVEKNNVNVWLVNTGWTGGPYGIGERISLKYTRSMVNSALNGNLDNIEYEKHEIFGLNIPKECPSIPSHILDPSKTWKNKDEYIKKAKRLAELFEENFNKFS